MSTPLTAIPELARNLSALRSLGYSTLEQLQGVPPHARALLNRYLNADLDQLLANTPLAAPSDDPEEMALVANALYPLGVEIDAIPRLESAPMMASFAELPASVNMVDKMSPVRDQQARGACVAFATIAAFEHSRGSTEDFSEQFLYAKCKELDGIPNRDGTYLGVAFPKVLAVFGVCLEETAPYNPILDPANYGQGPATAEVTAAAAQYKPASTWALSPTDVYGIKSELASGRCVAFSIPVFNSWYQNAAVRISGDIVMPIPGEIRNGGHAMCLVGYNDLPDHPEIGGGRFIVRNSWDAKWGIQSPNKAGYGTIPYAYISSHCVEAYALK